MHPGYAEVRSPEQEAASSRLFGSTARRTIKARPARMENNSGSDGKNNRENQKEMK